MTTIDDHRSAAGWTIFTLVLLAIAGLWIWTHVDRTALFSQEIAPSSDAKKVSGAAPPPLASRKPEPSSTGTDFTLWQAVHLSVLSDDAKAPDGTESAARVVEDTGDEARNIAASIEIDPTKPVTVELYAHAGKGRRLLLTLSAGNDGIDCDADLDSGKAIERNRGQVDGARCTTSASSNGWWIVTLAGRLKTPGHTVVEVSPTREPFEPFYQGDGTGNILLWTVAIKQ